LQNCKYPRFVSDTTLAQKSNHTHIHPIKPDNAAYIQNCILRTSHISPVDRKTPMPLPKLPPSF
ncbi:hypothetical protein ACQP3C_29230, partial [Escherichia coli]